MSHGFQDVSNSDGIDSEGVDGIFEASVYKGFSCKIVDDIRLDFRDKMMNPDSIGDISEMEMEPSE